ncbi:MAG: FAD-dependent oxidoreductase [Patescibacteria group bacterium]
MAKLYKLKLIERRETAENTMSFFCEKPAGFTFQPGQFVTLICDAMAVVDRMGDRRAMSIASSPTEETVHFSMRKSESAFKQSMARLEAGDTLSMLGPLGTFTLPQDTAQPLILVAGGIGITPFRSMVKFAADKKLDMAITLLYSCHHGRDMTYRAELSDLALNNKKFHLVLTLTKPDNQDTAWDGIFGKIDGGFIRSAVRNPAAATYMVVGPPRMVDAVEQTLRELTVPPERIKTEKFARH